MMRVISFFIAPGLSIPMSSEIFPNAYFMGFPVMPAEPEKPIFLACKVIKIIYLFFKKQKFRVLVDL